jgi:hypothetical protein
MSIFVGSFFPVPSIGTSQGAERRTWRMPGDEAIGDPRTCPEEIARHRHRRAELV